MYADKSPGIVNDIEFILTKEEKLKLKAEI